MSDIREKLERLLHGVEREKKYAVWVASPAPPNLRTDNLDELRKAAARELADAILAKFDVSEKNPKYRAYDGQVWGAWQRAVWIYVDGPRRDIPIAAFGCGPDSADHAREYCDFLNAKDSDEKR